MQVSDVPHCINVDARVLGDFLDVTSNLSVTSTWIRTRRMTHDSKSFFILDPIVLLYTSKPSHVDCNLTELTSRFQGLAQSTAAFN